MTPLASVSGEQVSMAGSDRENYNETITSREKKEYTVKEEPRVLVEDSDSPWQDPSYFDAPWQELLFVLSGMMGQLLNQAGATMTLSTMNVLAEELNSSGNKSSWLMASFPLVSGSFILISGRLGDIYGLKKMLLAGYAWLVIWSLICGLSSYSRNDTFFIVSRAFQGLGISFVLPNIMGIVGTIYKPGTRRKNMVISLIGMCAPIGATLGALFSGLTVVRQNSHWPWSFYAYAIAAFLTGIVSHFIIPKNIPINVNGFAMDWIGSALGVCGLILFNFVWNQSVVVGWANGYIIALLVVSVILIALFFFYELRYAQVPLLPKEVTKSRSTTMILASMMAGWGSFGIWTFYYFQIVLSLRHYSPVWAGGTYFMFSIWGCVAAMTVGLSIKKVGPAILLFFSMIAFTCGSIILSVTPVHQTYFRSCMGAMIILSFGMDLSFPAASIILSDELPMQYQGMAGSLVNTVVNYSMSLFLGIGGTVERQINKNGDKLLEGFRAALYFAVGVGGLGIMISGVFVLQKGWMRHKARKENQMEYNGS